MRQVFTTGQVAKICRVAPRTVCKWFDAGRIKGYRIPGSDDRRIPREQFVRFLNDNGMPTDGLEAFDNHLQRQRPAVLAIGLDPVLVAQLRELLDSEEFTLLAADDPFGAGLMLAGYSLCTCLIDCTLGRVEASDLALRIAVAYPEAGLILLANEDEQDRGGLATASRSHVEVKPCNPAWLAGLIMKAEVIE